MKNTLLVAAAFAVTLYSCSPKIDDIINATEVERIERVLAADDMRGRKTFSPEIDKAADFIAEEFKKSELEYGEGLSSYYQEFSMRKAIPAQIAGELNTTALDTSNVAVSTTNKEIVLTNVEGYEVVTVGPSDEFGPKVYPLLRESKNVVVLIDTTHTNGFNRIKRYASRAKFASPTNQIFVLTTEVHPENFSLQVVNSIEEEKLKNVVGIIPGASKKEEYVVFGAHYDHIGVGKPDAENDSIYNGANDDAAGTTAVVMLAKYFSQIKKNERTLVFVAFTAEEIGGFGSRYFSEQFDPEKVMAMFNIEMIGTDSKWGPNSAYITGYERSTMGEILQANLTGSKFHFEPDPYPKQNLFYRSDNATFAALGVPAHTISTSKMEEPPNDEPNYHKPSDEIETLDMNNMAEIIKAIALSSATIISGEDTPSRVVKENR